MNERFKFRVAIKQADGTFNRFEVYSFTADGTVEYLKESSFNPLGDVVMIETTIINNKTAFLEQCTGWQDTNKNWIFDGDLLLDSTGSTYKCYWCPQKACFIFRNVNDRHEYLDRNFSRRHWEVIGKIKL